MAVVSAVPALPYFTLRSNSSPSAHNYLINVSILCLYSRRYLWLGEILRFYLGDNNAYVIIYLVNNLFLTNLIYYPNSLAQVFANYLEFSKI